MLNYKEGVDFMSSTGNRYPKEYKQQLVEINQSVLRQ